MNYNITTTQVLIITKYSPSENQASSYGKEFLNSDEQMINMLLNYDTTKIKLFKDSHIRKGILSLEEEFYNTPTLDKNNFSLKPTVLTISNKKFQKYFKTIFGKNIEKGWRKFYNKYPGTHGIFEFPKILYEGKYAIFYVARHSNLFSRGGDLVIMQMRNDTWEIVTYVNIWMS